MGTRMMDGLSVSAHSTNAQYASIVNLLNALMPAVTHSSSHSLFSDLQTSKDRLGAT
jgi:hypothetical protein